jgi:type I restriction enzyme R subunit
MESIMSAVISRNFEFLRAKRPALADFGAFAEQYAHSDPTSSLLKQRGLIEKIVVAIYLDLQLMMPNTDNLNELLIYTSFTGAVPKPVLDMFHSVRISGNHAAHPRRPITKELALERLHDTFHISYWFHVRVDQGKIENLPLYEAPTPTATNGKAKEALDKLRALEEQHKQVLQTLEDERKQREEKQQQLAAVQQQVEKTKEELQRLQDEGQQVADLLKFDEATTRKRLIDQMLIDAGWNLNPNRIDASDIKQEVPVTGMPTSSGTGKVDYVLYGDNGKPLAVIEAKKTSKNAANGKEQAKLYADCLERMTGQRPVIFFTNGIDIYLWDDAQQYPYRRVYGFYSKDSLEYLLHQRSNKKALALTQPNHQIADRMYQLEAVKRICERFTEQHRKGLLVQATGTGKTRVAISICDVLLRAGWAKRILFLCDRKELRKQADNAFKNFLPGEPRVTVSSATADDKNQRIYLATYQSMIEYYDSFDVGFFDLILADESHRSIYNKFRALFLYFDALQVGLTATPVKLIDRNTYGIFDCRDKNPTSHFSYEEAITNNPPYLVPFRVKTLSSDFRRKGMKYAEMTDEQKQQLEAQDADAQSVEYDASEIDRIAFNKDTTRGVWRTLMEEGIREATQSRVGKTIVFARNHNHAIHLQEVFNEMYPAEAGRGFCKVIDTQIAYAEQLIDDLKNPSKEPTIAISVDMLDTGIDIPEVVNLVFAKPVQSYVKFWQMIGRGTRLCKNLFGPGNDKTEFLVFDHWQNFQYFGENYQETEGKVQKSLLQRLFEARISLADIAQQNLSVVPAVVGGDPSGSPMDPRLREGDVRSAHTRIDSPFELAVGLLLTDLIEAKATDSINVRDKLGQLELLSNRAKLEQFAATTRHELLSIAAPVMQWRNIRGEEPAYRFDHLIALSQIELLKVGAQGPSFLDRKGDIEDQVELLLMNQNPVRAKEASIQKVQSRAFWDTVTVQSLEELRLELRDIMKYQKQESTINRIVRTYDVEDTNFTNQSYVPKLEGLQLVEYKNRVEKVLREKFAQSPILQKIRSGEPVQETELEELVKLVLKIDDKANITFLAGHEPEKKRSLLTVFRSLVGLDAAAVEKAFTGFVHKYPNLSAQQLRFLQLLQNHITQNGGIEIERLYEAPFTNVHAESVDGVFAGKADDLLEILKQFEPKVAV